MRKIEKSFLENWLEKLGICTKLDLESSLAKIRFDLLNLVLNLVCTKFSTKYLVLNLVYPGTKFSTY
jgi:hypothetical protein